MIVTSSSVALDSTPSLTLTVSRSDGWGRLKVTVTDVTDVAHAVLDGPHAGNQPVGT